MDTSAARCTGCDWSWVADGSDELANAMAEIAAEGHVRDGHVVLLTQVIRPDE